MADIKDPGKNMRIAFLAIFVLLVLVFGYLIYRDQQEVPEDQGVAAEDTLKELQAALDVKSEIRDTIYIDWVNSDGESLPLQGRQFILNTNGVNGLGEYGNLSSDDLMQVNAEFLNPLAQKIKEFYLTSGFVENAANSSNKPNELWFLSQGFEKGNLYCVTKLAQQSDPFAYLSCGTVDTDQMALQKELNSILVEAKAQEKESPVPLIFRVDKVDGDFASGSISSLGGYQWIAQNTDGTWKRVWAGNDMPLCSDMEKNNVPKSFYPGCYDPETESTISSPDYVQN